MENKIKEFLINLSQIYAISGSAKTVINENAKYLTYSLNGIDIDFDRVQNLIFDKYDKKSFPLPNELLTFFLKGEIKRNQQSEDEGSLAVMTLPNGKKYSFTICSFGLTLEEIKAREKRKDTNVADCEFEIYPKGSVLIGDTVFLPE